MEFHGSEAYDKEQFFQAYLNRRHRKESPNKLIENPLLLDLLGTGYLGSVLDLGCGDASMGRLLLEANRCESYTGADGSSNMCKKAEAGLAGLNGTICCSRLEDFPFPKETFQTVVSQLALHYIEDLDVLFQRVYRTLAAGGRFVFSVQHPLLTASFKSSEASGSRTDWIVDDYFVTGKRTEPWVGEKVVKYHRTTEGYFRMLKAAGFQISDLREGMPVRGNFEKEEEYNRRMRIPLFLLFSCIKDSSSKC